MYCNQINNDNKMKYSDLHKFLKLHGCSQKGEESGHPQWYSPHSGKHFATSHHRSQEVANGTLDSILKLAGLKKQFKERGKKGKGKMR